MFPAFHRERSSLESTTCQSVEHSVCLCWGAGAFFLSVGLIIQTNPLLCDILIHVYHYTLLFRRMSPALLLQWSFDSETGGDPSPTGVRFMKNRPDKGSWASCVALLVPWAWFPGFTAAYRQLLEKQPQRSSCPGQLCSGCSNSYSPVGECGLSSKAVERSGK